MAKKDNFDFDDWDDWDDFGDFEDGSGSGGFKSTTKTGKAREAVTALSGGLVSGIKKNLFSRSFYQKLTTNALPKEYSAALDKSLEATDAIGDIYDTARRETRDTNDKLTKGVKPIVDKYGDKLPKRMQRPLREWTRNVRSTSEWTTQNKEELETVAALNDIFNKREQTKSANNTSLQSQVQTGIAQTNMSLTSQMLNNQRQMLAYQDQVDAKWKRKSMELQYKQLFVQRKLLDVTEQSLALDKATYRDLIKNTGLPDMVKAQKSEVATKVLSEKIYGAAIDRFSALPYNILKSTVNNITKKIKDGGAELRESIADTFDNLDSGIEEGADVASDLGALGSLRVGGNMAADPLSGYLAKILGKRLKKRYGENENVKKGADILSSGMKRLPRIFGDMVKSEDTGSDLLDMILELTDMRTQIEGNNGVVSNNTSTNLDTQVYFDLLTKKSITEIIPGYLTRIHHELVSLRTGETRHPLLDYDYSKNVFSNETIVAKTLRDSVIGSRNTQTLSNSHTELVDKLGISDLDAGVLKIFLKEFSMASLNNSDFTLRTLMQEDNTALDETQKKLYADYMFEKFQIEDDFNYGDNGFVGRFKNKIGNVKDQTADAAKAQRTVTEALETLHSYLGNPTGNLNRSARKGQLSHAIRTGIVDEREGRYTVNYSRYIDALMENDPSITDTSGDFEKEEKDPEPTSTRKYFNNRKEELDAKIAELRSKYADSSTKVNLDRVTSTVTQGYNAGRSRILGQQPAPVQSRDVKNFKRTFTETRLTNMNSKYGSNDKIINAIEYVRETTNKPEVSSSDLEQAYEESKTFRDLVNDAIQTTQQKKNAVTSAVKARLEPKTTDEDEMSSSDVEKIVADVIAGRDGSSFKDMKFSASMLPRLGTPFKGSRALSDLNKVKDKAVDIKEAAKQTVNDVRSKTLDPNMTGAVKLLFEVGRYATKAAGVLTKPHRDALKLIPWGIKKLISSVVDTSNFSHVKHGLWLPGEQEPRLLRTGLMSGRYLNGDGDVIATIKDIHGNIYDAMSTPAELIMSASEYKVGLYDSSGKLIYKPPSLTSRVIGSVAGFGKKLAMGSVRMMGKAFMGYLNITTKPARWMINRILREDRIDPKLHAELVQLGLTEQTNQKIDTLTETIKAEDEKKFNDSNGDGKRDGNVNDVLSARNQKREEAKQKKQEKSDKKGLFEKMFGKKKKEDDDDEGFNLMSLMGKAKGLGRLSGLLKNPYVMGALALTGLVSYEALTDKAKTQNPEDIANLVLPESVQDSLAARIGVRVADFALDKVVLGNIRNSAKAVTKIGEWGLRGAKWFDRKKDKLNDGFKNQLNKVPGVVTGILFGKGARKNVDRLLNADNATPLFRFRMAQYGFKYNDTQAVEAILKFEDDILKSLIPASDKSAARIADSITIEQSAAYFDVSINDEADLSEWMSWYTNRFRPVFLSAVTVMQRLGYNSRQLHEVDSMLTKKHKLEFISKTNFWRRADSPYDTNVNPLPTEWRLSYSSQDDVYKVYEDQVAEIQSMSDDVNVVKADQARTKKRENKKSERAKAVHANTKPSTRFDPYAMIDKLSTKTVAKAFNKSKSVNEIDERPRGGEFSGAGAGASFAAVDNSNTISKNGILGAAGVGFGKFFSNMFMKEAHASTFIPEMQYGGASKPLGNGTAAAKLIGGSTLANNFTPNKADGSKSYGPADKPLKAVDYLRQKARTNGSGLAAKHIKEGLMAAGYRFKAPASSSDYPAQALPDMGFVKIDNATPPQVGDIMVFTSTKEYRHGHIQMYDGANWISDHVQLSWSPFPHSTPSHTLWRDKQFTTTGSISVKVSKQKDALGNLVKRDTSVDRANSSTREDKESKPKGLWDRVKDVKQMGKEAVSSFLSGLDNKLTGGRLGNFLNTSKDRLSNTLARMSGSQKEWQLCVYKAFKTAGFSEQQSRILTAEIGRENSYNPKYLFAGHADPHKGSNLGMLSWQGDRKPRLINFLKAAKVLDGSNNMVPGQEALDAQAKFIMWEMRNTHKAVGSVFLSKPNISYDEGAYMIGKRYILWRIDDPKYGPAGKKNRDGFYNMLLKQLSTGAVVNTADKSSPATKSVASKAVGVVSNAFSGVKNAVSSIVGGGSDPRATEDTPTSSEARGNLPASAKPVVAARYVRKNAKSGSIGKCARFVRMGLQAAGYKFNPKPSAYMYAEGTLSSAGFGQISTKTPYQIGDIIVVGRSAKHIHGHICIWDGKNWVSDFVQRKWNPYSTPQSYTLWRDRNYLNGASASSGPTSGTGTDSGSSTFGDAGAASPSYNPVSMKYNDYSGIDDQMNASWKNGVPIKSVPKMSDTKAPTVTDPDKVVVKTKKSSEIVDKVDKTVTGKTTGTRNDALVNNFAPGVSSVPDEDYLEEKKQTQVRKSLTQQMSESETKRVNETIVASNAILQESLTVQRQMLDRLTSLDRHLLEISKGQKSRNVVESSQPSESPRQSRPNNQTQQTNPRYTAERAGRNEPMSMSKMI